MPKRKKTALQKAIKELEPTDNVIRPNSYPQLQFIQSTAFECFYAGAAGAGKTFALLLAAAKNHEDPNYRAVIFRNTMPEVTKVLIEQSKQIYPYLGAKYNHRNNCWNFPSGAIIYFSYMQDNADIQKHLGAEYQFIGFDELVTFKEDQFMGLMKRLRSSRSGAKRVIRATSNPPVYAKDSSNWVFYRYFQWLNHSHTECIKQQEETGKPSCPHSGTVLNIDGIITQVIMGSVLDNYQIVNASPEYIATLKSGTKLEVAAYYYNDWTVRAPEGRYFSREKFEFVDAAPADAKRIRAWDLAMTLNGDYTVGVLLAMKNGTYYVEDIIRKRLKPDEVEALILNTAEMDTKAVAISLPKEPAGAGKFLQANFSKLLTGYTFTFRSETGDKETKAQPVAAQVGAGNVRIVRAAWMNDFILELEEFPDGKYDDQVDAFAGAFNSSIGQVYIGYRRFRNIRPRMF